MDTTLKNRTELYNKRILRPDVESEKLKKKIQSGMATTSQLVSINTSLKKWLFEQERSKIWKMYLCAEIYKLEKRKESVLDTNSSDTDNDSIELDNLNVQSNQNYSSSKSVSAISRLYK